MAFSFTTTRDAIGYSILADYREGYHADGGSDLVEICQVNWLDKDRFIQAVLPDVAIGPQDTTRAFQISAWNGSFSATAAAGNLNNQNSRRIVIRRAALLRKNPQKHRIYVNKYAVAAEVVGGDGYVAANGQSLQFKRGPSPRPPASTDGFARIAVTYRPLTYVADVEDNLTNAEIPDDDTNPIPPSELRRYVTRECKTASKGMVMQGAGMTLLSDGRLDMGQSPENYAKVFAERHLTYTWHMVPQVPYACGIMPGQVNGHRFDPLNTVIRSPTGSSIGTVLYLSHEVSKPYFTCTDTRVVDITFHFLVRMNRNYRSRARIGVGAAARYPFLCPVTGHNHYWLPSANAWLQGYRGQPTSDIDDTLTVAEISGARIGTVPQRPGTSTYDYGNLHALFRMDGDVIEAGGETM